MLDPADPVRAGCVWAPSGELAEAVRRFGKYPNIEKWRPGDVLLVCALKQDWVARQIVAVQTRRYGPEHGRWQHAAIYMGNGFVAEATTRGVKYTPLDHYVGSYHLRLRRNPLLTDDQRWLVAIEAGVRLRAAYGFADILSIYRNSFPALRRQLKPSVMMQANSVICSQLCQEAHAKVTNQLIVPFASTPTVPAALSLTRNLENVDLCWCTIA